MRLTVVAILVASGATPVAAQTIKDKDGTLKYLASLQQDDGGFAPTRPKEGARVASSLRATSAAVRAFKYLGGEVPNRAMTCRFVEACRVPGNGAFADVPGGKEDVIVTAVGMMAVAELFREPRFDASLKYLATQARTFEERRLAVAGMEAAKTFDPVVTIWLNDIRKTGLPDGTFGQGDRKAFETGSVAAMILRSGHSLTPDQKAAIRDALRAGQRPDGGFSRGGEPSDLEATYRILRAFHLLGETPRDVDGLRAFINRCRNPDGGYGLAPGQSSSASATYFAAVVAHWLDR